jgi:hypothetical protein
MLPSDVDPPDILPELEQFMMVKTEGIPAV